MSLTALISNISRCSLHDGPGVRTVIYFKGCALRCRWCHNPETLSAKADILYAPVKCIRCGRCVSVCPEHHIVIGNEMHFNHSGCIQCGRCAEACPTGALTASGRQYTFDEVLNEIRKDAHYYRRTGGGVTLSGGECLLQSEFAAALLKACREEGIHTAIESALFVPWENIERVLPYCDLFMLDLKLPDSERHLRCTGQGNELILQNLTMIAERAKGNILLRIPLIPDVNDSIEDMSAFADVILPIKDSLTGIELLRYNALAEGKYALIGMEYERFAETAQPEEYVQQLASTLSRLLGGLTVHY